MKKHYFLFATQVVYQKHKLEYSRNYNVLINSENPFVTHDDLGHVQQMAQVRHFTEFDTHQRYRILDVFIQSVSHLGLMTEDEFKASFTPSNEPEEKSKTIQDKLYANH